MSILWMDGMDHYSSTALLPLAYTSAQFINAVGPTFGRFSGSSAGIQSISSFNNINFSMRQTIPPSRTIISGVGMRIFDLNQSIVVMAWHVEPGNSASQLALTWIGNQLQLRTGVLFGSTIGTNLFTYTGSVNWTGYPSFETMVNCGPTASAMVWMNGVLIMSQSNFSATGSSPSSSIVSVSIGGQTGNSNVWMDDFWILDTSGSTMNNPVGDVRIRTLYPISSSVNQWSISGSAQPHLAVTSSDNDTSFVFASGSPSDQLFVGTGIETNKSVRGLFRATLLRKDDAGSPDVRMILSSSGAIIEDSRSLSIGTSYLYNYTAYDVNPFTGTPWNRTSINALQFGLRRKT